MKIKILSRNPDNYLRETKLEPHKVPRNFDPAQHPFQHCREYVRALNATKLERVFAKPFMGSLDGHRDGVCCMAKHPKRLPVVLSGSYDGEVRLWDLANRKCFWHAQAHEGFIRGICVEPSTGDHFLTVGDDKCIKQWCCNGASNCANEPLQTIPTKNILYDISHHYDKPMFATCGEGVFIWDYNRTTPIRTFDWGVDTIHRIKYNPVETDIFAAAANDRSVILFDSRGNVPLRKVVLKMKSNAVSWNPMEAFIFTVANEDYNLYTFDMRNLSSALVVHVDHVAAVMDLDYSPTGREFVSGGYDKNIRIFPCDSSRSREVYHTKRMQRIMSVLYSNDAKYVLSGSDETNIRVWKAVAWQKLGQVRAREREMLEYNEKLKNKYAAHPEIKRIAKNRHVPKHIFNARKELAEIRKAKKRRETNLKLHSKAGSVPETSIKKQSICAEQE